MKISGKLISLCLIVLILLGYISFIIAKNVFAVKNNNDSILTDSSSQNNETTGVSLELIGVSDQYKPIFNANFHIIEDAFKKISDERPDLKTAKMMFDATNNRIDFIYNYIPKSDDIDMSSSKYAMYIRLAKYNSIAAAINEYIINCILQLEKVNNALTLKKNQQIYICYYYKKDYYLNSCLAGGNNIIFGVQLPEKDLIQVNGHFATATFETAVNQPQNTLSGDSSPEQAMIDFFNLKN